MLTVLFLLGPDDFTNDVFSQYLAFLESTFASASVMGATGEVVKNWSEAIEGDVFFSIRFANLHGVFPRMVGAMDASVD